MKRVVFDTHASSRLVARCSVFSLNLDEAKRRALETINEKRLSSTKRSKINKIYYKYYADNLSFFVICDEGYGYVKIKTIIINRGRE